MLDSQRPVLQASRPSQTIATMGPLSMSEYLVSNGCASHKLLHTCNETLEERLRGEIFVVLLKMFLGRRDHLQGYQFVSSLLESGHDVSNKSALDAIWLDGNEGLFVRHLECSWML